MFELFFTELEAIATRPSLYKVHSCRNFDMYIRGRIYTMLIHNYLDEQALTYVQHFNKYISERYNLKIEKNSGEILDFILDCTLNNKIKCFLSLMKEFFLKENNVLDKNTPIININNYQDLKIFFIDYQKALNIRSIDDINVFISGALPESNSYKNKCFFDTCFEFFYFTHKYLRNRQLSNIHSMSSFLVDSFGILKTINICSSNDESGLRTFYAILDELHIYFKDTKNISEDIKQNFPLIFDAYVMNSKTT